MPFHRGAVVKTIPHSDLRKKTVFVYFWSVFCVYNDAERFHSKLMGNVQQTNVEFYDLINILEMVSLTIESDSKLFAMGLLKSKPKRASRDFVILLRETSLKLKNKAINNFEFLNIVTASDHNNQISDETWLQNSRVDLLPEQEFEDLEQAP